MAARAVGKMSEITDCPGEGNCFDNREEQLGLRKRHISGENKEDLVINRVCVKRTRVKEKVIIRDDGQSPQRFPSGRLSDCYLSRSKTVELVSVAGGEEVS